MKILRSCRKSKKGKRMKKKIKLSKKDIASIQKQLGYHNSGVEYKVTYHTENVYKAPGI